MWWGEFDRGRRMKDNHRERVICELVVTEDISTHPFHESRSAVAGVKFRLSQGPVIPQCLAWESQYLIHKIHFL